MVNQLDIAPNRGVLSRHGVQSKWLNQRERGGNDATAECSCVREVASLNGSDTQELGNVELEAEDLLLRSSVVQWSNFHARHFLDVVDRLPTRENRVCLRANAITHPHAIEQRVREGDAALEMSDTVTHKQQRENVILHWLMAANLNTGIKHVVPVERIAGRGESGGTTARDREVLNVWEPNVH